MFRAYDNDIMDFEYAMEAVRGHSFKCPKCGDALVLRRGQVHQPHFAHSTRTECVIVSDTEGRGYSDELYEMLYSVTGVENQKRSGVAIEAIGNNIAVEVIRNGQINYEEFERINNELCGKVDSIVWILDLSNRREMLVKDTNQTFYVDEKVKMYSLQRASDIFAKYSYSYGNNKNYPAGIRNKDTRKFYKGVTVLLYQEEENQQNFIRVCYVPKHYTEFQFFGGKAYDVDNLIRAIKKYR